MIQCRRRTFLHNLSNSCARNSHRLYQPFGLCASVPAAWRPGPPCFAFQLIVLFCTTCCKLQRSPKMLAVSGVCSVTPAMLEVSAWSSLQTYGQEKRNCQCCVSFRSPQMGVQNGAETYKESWTWRRHQLGFQITDLRREQRSFRLRLEEQSLERERELAETLAAIADNLNELLLDRNENLSVTRSLHYDREDDTCNATIATSELDSKGFAAFEAEGVVDERRVGAKGQQQCTVFNNLSSRTSSATTIHASILALESRQQDDNLATHENPKESISQELGLSTIRRLKKLDVHDYVHGALRSSHMRSWLQSRKIEEDSS